VPHILLGKSRVHNDMKSALRQARTKLLVEYENRRGSLGGCFVLVHFFRNLWVKRPSDFIPALPEPE
jgi:hypothetical protein